MCRQEAQDIAVRIANSSKAYAKLLIDRGKKGPTKSKPADVPPKTLADSSNTKESKNSKKNEEKELDEERKSERREERIDDEEEENEEEGED